MNPDETTVNSVSAAGTQEPIASHVAVIVVAAVLGVFLLRAAHFKFVVAAGAGIG